MSNEDVQRKLLDVTQNFESSSALMDHIELLRAMGYPSSWADVFYLHYNKRIELAARQAEIERTGLDPLDLSRQFTCQTDLTAYLQGLKGWGYSFKEIQPYALQQVKKLLVTDHHPDSQSPASP